MAYYLECIQCGRSYRELVLRCPACGGLTLIKYTGERFSIDRSRPGIWRYFPLPHFERIVSKGEGMTPISRMGGVAVKNERYNPTGSYSDRASSVIASYVASKGVGAVITTLERDFTGSLAYYLSDLARLYVAVPDILSLSYSDLLILEEAGSELVALGAPVDGHAIEYPNPLTVEGLKTIAFEIYERGARVEDVVVPASTGILALSLAKGFRELEEAGHHHSYRVAAAVLKGGGEPEVLRLCRCSKVVEVPEEEVLRALTRLGRMGIKTNALSALAYAAAEEPAGSLAVVTMGFKGSGRRPGDSSVRRRIAEILGELGEATAYEIWKRMPVYTLRGTYKILSAMEKEGEVCSEVRPRGRRKVRYYTLCRSVDLGSQTLRARNRSFIPQDLLQRPP